MEIVKSDNLGFCFGVRKAVDACLSAGPAPVCTLGKLIHNSFVISELEKRGIRAVSAPSEMNGGTLVVRSHGAPEEVIKEARELGINVIDATCPFVQKTRDIVREKYAAGYKIAIYGKKDHPEIIGINSVCNYSALVFDGENVPPELTSGDRYVLVSQTTADAASYKNIVDILSRNPLNLVEICDTICYTTHNRQNETLLLSKECDAMIVIGDPGSSNTLKLYGICIKSCKNTVLAESVDMLKKINFKKSCRDKNVKKIGITAGASTPDELITEVIHYMSGKDTTFTDASNAEFLSAVEGLGEVKKSPKNGKRMKVTVADVTPDGLTVNFEGKIDGKILANEASVDGTYNPDDFKVGDVLDVQCTSDKAEGGVYYFSKKIVDQVNEADKVVDTIRNGEEFSIIAEKDVSKGLLGKLGSYSVFIPASHVKEKFVTDLKPFVGKPLRLVAIDIDDTKKKIVASQKNILVKERKEREDIFWSSVVPGVVVNGKVKNITSFGVFVSVDGTDCLVRLNDVSWVRLKSPEEVLQKGKKYDFLVISADKDKKKVQLGYKQLQKHPFALAVEEHPVGSVFKGKITSVLAFGAFVQIAPGVEGLIHVSEASNVYVKDINEVFKPGDEVDVKVLAVDSESKKFTLSAKACMPETPREEKVEEKPAKEERKGKSSKKREEKPEESSEWIETADNNVFADLLKDIDVKKD